MELTLKRLLEQAKFTTTRKGYDQDEVDDFLDRAVAMATKVEARLTQALAEAGQGAPSAAAEPTRSDEEIQAEIASEVEKRVQARIAEIEAAAPQRSVGDNDGAAEEAARTLVLAQRTADAAVAEARAEADQILAQARDTASEVTGRAERESDERRRALEEEAERERSEARGRLATEIHALEDARNSLRTDVSMLEGHVEEQRLQLRSTVAELQRLLEDPAAFRLAPAPRMRDVAVPPLDDGDPAPGQPLDQPSDPSTDDHTAAADQGPSAGTGPEADLDPAGGSAPSDHGAPADDALAPGEIEIIASPDHDDPGAGRETIDLTGPSVEPSPQPDPESFLDAGPPTAPVSAVELDFDEPDAEPDHARSSSPAPGSSAPASSDDAEGDDAFLAELRKAMADEEPLGPRDAHLGGMQPGFLDEERRGWRFGKRR